MCEVQLAPRLSHVAKFVAWQAIYARGGTILIYEPLRNALLDHLRFVDRILAVAISMRKIRSDRLLLLGSLIVNVGSR
jgi:hypothetical protein